jgi:hypothetical protein
MKRVISIFISCTFFLIYTSFAFAVVDPLESPNNKYGIHIVDENDLSDATGLVNSEGGQWGYITMVMTENDRDTGKWQRTFDTMRRDKVIPVIRLATSPQEQTWKKPREEDIDKWVDFLGKLNWVVQNRYIVLFNEPNHAKEWGGELNPEEYARIAKVFQNKLKEKSPDFFVLPAGLDQATRNSADTMDALEFYRRINVSDPTYFSIFDGWTVHAYPNPNFSGSPNASGRASVRGHLWELAQLKQDGVSSSIPVFITETGWAHQDGKGPFLSSDIVASFYQDAYTNAWNDNRIVMVSPFIFNYQDTPFSQFSWKKPNSTDFYPQYHSVKSIAKTEGKPIEIDKTELDLEAVPTKLTIDSLFLLPVEIRNIGQKIWDENTDFTLNVKGATPETQTIKLTIDYLEPFQEKTVKVAIKTPDQEGIIPVAFTLEKNGITVEKDNILRITVTEPASLWGKTVLFIKQLMNDIK